jgi:hypothetical protein
MKHVSYRKEGECESTVRNDDETETRELNAAIALIQPLVVCQSKGAGLPRQST